MTKYYGCDQVDFAILEDYKMAVVKMDDKDGGCKSGLIEIGDVGVKI